MQVTDTFGAYDATFHRLSDGTFMYQRDNGGLMPLHEELAIWPIFQKALERTTLKRFAVCTEVQIGYNGEEAEKVIGVYDTLDEAIAARDEGIIEKPDEGNPAFTHRWLCGKVVYQYKPRPIYIREVY